MIGRQGMKPVPPLNLVGNFAGGGMMLASAFVCEMKEAQKIKWLMQSSLMKLHSSWQCFFSRRSAASFMDERGTNLLDGGYIATISLRPAMASMSLLVLTDSSFMLYC